MKIPLTIWAGRRYSPPPPIFTLRRWCRDGEIHPAPEKVGREWYVEDTARRLTGAEPIGGGLVRQLMQRA